MVRSRGCRVERKKTICREFEASASSETRAIVRGEEVKVGPSCLIEKTLQLIKSSDVLRGTRSSPQRRDCPLDVIVLGVLQLLRSTLSRSARHLIAGGVVCVNTFPILNPCINSAAEQRSFRKLTRDSNSKLGGGRRAPAALVDISRSPATRFADVTCIRLGDVTALDYSTLGGTGGDRPPTVVSGYGSSGGRAHRLNSRREMGHRTRRMPEQELVLVHQYRFLKSHTHHFREIEPT
ncbi:hypothetical protein EVAR_7517_1 [Eumeta japonica]|uniref:Uncharacterized protein n=1 Tax=Eumeta variegata TaxID=151549 RepID=A0A4C2A529_EUMVA|nr:hypothetical protein EVAR_7517_1 [Eumeta japonica]